MVRPFLHHRQGMFSRPLHSPYAHVSIQSSSFVGPLVVGLIADTTGNIRYAFFFLVIMIWAAVPVLMAVDVERGREDAQRYAAHAAM